MSVRITIANEIDTHAKQATANANEAMHHAIEAGKLLLEVKASLAHGQFADWMEANIKVSPRQAQRYMWAAEGKPVPIRSLSSKYDTVSYLTDETKQAVTDWQVPTWTPTPGRWMGAATDEAAWWVVPSLEHPGFFHVSKFYQDATATPDSAQPDWNGQCLFDGTKQPVGADVVEAILQLFGLMAPINAKWISREKPGLSRPFGEPDLAYLQRPVDTRKPTTESNSANGSSPTRPGVDMALTVAPRERELVGTDDWEDF